VLRPMVGNGGHAIAAATRAREILADAP
jgi:hypothetical protein